MEVITLGDARLFFATKPEDILIEHQITNAYIVNKPWLVSGMQLLDDLNKGYFKVAIMQGNPSDLINQIKRSIRCIEAGGGLVLNEEGEILMIFRNGVWDLPKGKRDEGEKISDCALREVQEETGITSLQLGSFIDITRHFYSDSLGWILKETYWYRMQAPNRQLVPQTEEGISEACWVAPSSLPNRLLNTYYSIKFIVQKAGYV